MLKTFLFYEEDIVMEKIFENHRSMNEIRKHSKNKHTPDKIDKNYGELIFPHISDKAMRPYFTGSMILSMDGRMGFQDDPSSRTLAKANKEDPTRGMADLWMVNVLRTFADAIILGGATLHAEPEFTGHVYDPELQQYRLEMPGQFNPIPWNILITRNPENLPWQHPVLDTSEIPVLMVIPSDKMENISLCAGKNFCYQQVKIEKKSDIMKAEFLREDEEKHLVAVLPEKDFPDWTLMMELLNRLDIKQVTVESPHWIYELMQNKALDEIFATHTGVYTGGSVIPGKKQAFPSEEAPVSELVSIHMTGNNVLMTRQKLRYGNGKK